MKPQHIRKQLIKEIKQKAPIPMSPKLTALIKGLKITSLTKRK